MKIQNLLAVLGVAVATMALTLALVGPGRVEAVDQDATAIARIEPVISQPTLTLAGLQVKLTMDKPQYAPGDEPTFTLEATNPTEHRVATNVWVGMTSSSVEASLSRAPTMPRYDWSENYPLALDPGKTVTLRLEPGQQLAADTTVSVTMSDTDQKVALAKLLELRTRTIAQRANKIEVDDAVATALNSR